MTDSRDRVRDIAESIGLKFDNDRLEQLAQAYEQAIAEADSVRQEKTTWPAPSEFDAAWSEKR